MRNNLAKLLVFLVVLLPVSGQTDRGTVTGQVTDPASAAVANATLELRGVETGSVYPGVSSATGNYTFTQIPIGTYELTATSPGFKRFVRQNLRVEAAQTLGVNIPLEIGTATESVTVSAEVSLLKTESSDVSTNVDTSRLIALAILPIGAGNSSALGVRSPMAVANLTPGTFYDPSNNLRVNGAPSNTMSVRVEGQDAVTNVIQAREQAQVQPSVDSIQEVAIQTSNYAAEYGQAGGGLFNYTIKSGTNQLHGSAYEYFSNEFLNASQSYTGVRPRQRRSDYGFTVGGPVRVPSVYDGRNKTFFFFSYEAFLEKQQITTAFPTVPIDGYRVGNFASALSGATVAGTGGVNTDVTGQRAIDGQIFDPLTQVIARDGRRVRNPFPDNIIPVARFDPSAVKVLNLIPRATLPGLVSNYNNPYPSERRTWIPGVKIDHSITSKAKISGYWSNTRTASQFCNTVCGTQGFPVPIDPTRGVFIETQTERINFDYTLTPTMLFHLGAGFQSNDFKDTAAVTNFDVAGTLGIKGATRGPNDGARFPNFATFVGGNSRGGQSALGPAGQSRTIEQKPTFNASITSVLGNHTFKIGGEGRTEGYPQSAFTNNSGAFTFAADQSANPWFSDSAVTLTGGVTGFPFASFLMGRVNQVTLSAPANTRGGRKFIGLFAQDTWKVSRKLTVDYGLRWDLQSYSREQYGRTPNFSATTPNSTAGGRLGASIYEGSGPFRCNCSFAQNYPYAYGPRLGAAYQINDKTVLRAGIGWTYSSSPGGLQGAAGAAQTANAPGFGDPSMVLSQGFPLTPIWPDLRANLFPDPTTFAGQPALIDNNSGRPARQVQWSVGLQREVVRDLVIEVSYVGNRGNWWRTATLNQYNGLRPEILKSQYGLDITNTGDRAILSSQVGQAAAGRFRNLLPFAGFPANFSVARSLTPFPHFGTFSSAGPLGKTWYDSLQSKITKRFSHGLDANFIFTWSKELQLGAESDTGGIVGQVNDVFNRNTNKQLSSFSRPLVSILALSYTVPKMGSNKFVNLALADWTIGSVLQYGSGFPIPVPGTATANIATALLRGTHAERVDGQPLFLQDLNCHCFDPAQTQVLNPKAWADPLPGTFANSAVYYGDYRFQRRPRESMSFGRILRFSEKGTIQLRAELSNPFNRTQVPNPVAGSTIGVGPGAAAPGNFTTLVTTQTVSNGLKVNNAGFGAISTQGAAAVIGERSGLLSARITF